MYRVLTVILLAYAVCFPQLVSHTRADIARQEPSRAARLLADAETWLKRPISIVLAALQKPQG